MYLDKIGSCGNGGVGFVLVFCCAFWIWCGLFSELWLVFVFLCVFLLACLFFLGTFSDVFMMLACKGIKLFLLFLRKFKQFSLCCIVKKPRELRPVQVKRCRLHMVLVVLRISLMKEPGEC